MTITPESVQQLLSSEDYGDRLIGVNQLRELDQSLAFELIEPLITDSNPRVRYAAVSQLDTLGKENMEKTLELLRDRLFHDGEVDVKAAAADVVGALKLTDAYELIETLYYQSSEWLIQVSIVAALGEMGEPRGFNILKDALNSENSLIRTSAISSMGELGNPEAISLLTPFATDEDWQIRLRVAQALGNLGGSQVQDILKQLSSDTMELVAQQAQFFLTS
ncbi:MAG: phycobilisome degradation protein NblB [Microcystaceae cyanobacterium]